MIGDGDKNQGMVSGIVGDRPKGIGNRDDEDGDGNGVLEIRIRENGDREKWNKNGDWGPPGIYRELNQSWSQGCRDTVYGAVETGMEYRKSEGDRI